MTLIAISANRSCNMAGIQISMCVQLSGLEIVVYDSLDEVLV